MQLKKNSSRQQSKPEIIQTPSPHFNERATGTDIRFLVLHYTGLPTAQHAIDIFTGKDSDTNPDGQVSTHYLIDKDGTIYQFVDDTKRAWHAGISYWNGITDMNSHSIGIELQNPGHEFGYRPFPEQQLLSLVALCKMQLGQYGIKPENVLAHSDIAPDRKLDPGELFPWERLANEGIGIWPEPHATTKQELIDFGYDPECNEETLFRAYHRRFAPEKLTKI